MIKNSSRVWSISESRFSCDAVSRTLWMDLWGRSEHEYCVLVADGAAPLRAECISVQTSGRLRQIGWYRRLFLSLYFDIGAVFVFGGKYDIIKGTMACLGIKTEE